ncbi:MAG TPA: MmgE/PrpD family protein [Sandaracinaceae bacterium LLY-WYZ-13_1]|nr:MmgE/PrpD family protein [Sandaracinaceae bacterium LLY-WYZ-13_1]
MSVPHLTRLARWAVELRAEDVPPDVLELARAQLRSVLASVVAGADAAAPARRAALSLSTRGDATVLPSGERVAAFAAVLANASASMAQDFDDYLFLGHTGHSSVLAPIAVGEEVDATVGEVLVAQVVANEIAGRLGAFVALGPQNGQLWAHIHLGAAAVAAARLRGLDAEECADALGLAFYQPPRTLWPGFMGSEAKIMTAAWPTAQGLYASSLAAQGLDGARDLLEHPHGFGRTFAFEALPQVLTGLGDGWVSRSTSVKPTPGCAYTTAPVEAALRAVDRQPLDPGAIRAVRIRASALTTGMESMCEASVPSGSLAPIAINFSARRSVAVALLAGELTPGQMRGDWIGPRTEALERVLSVTTVDEDRDMTLGVLEGLGRAVPLAGLVREVGVGRLARAGRRMSAALPGAFRRGGGLPSGDGLRSLGAVLRNAGPFALDRARFDRLAFRFAAEVEVTRRDGRTRRARCDVPPGAAGTDPASVVAVSREKLRAEAPSIAETLEARLADAAAPIRDLTSTLHHPEPAPRARTR